MECAIAESLDRWLIDLSEGTALDLGPGEVKCSLWLARRGFQVEAVELDPDIAKSIERAAAGHEIVVHNQDLRDFAFPVARYHLILAQSILHFLAPSELWSIADRMVDALLPGGYLFAEVFTVDDPGYAASKELKLQEFEPNTFQQPDRPGIIHYFTPGELRRVFQNLACLEYVEARSLDPDAQPAYRASASLLARKDG
jgi:hypothetical protein